MRKIALTFIALAVLTLPQAGCFETFQIAGQAISLVNKTAANPVTKDDLAKFQVVSDGIIQELSVYKSACIAGTVDKNCRANIAAVQAYTRQIPPYVAQLRSFVKTNDQISAGVVYTQLTTLLTNLKTTATQLGLKIGT